MSKWLIVGSVAMYHWFPDSRKPKDIDLLTPAKIVGNDSRVCVVDSQWHELAERLIESNHDPVFATPNLLYTLKVSHAHWDIHFDKTLFDIHFLQGKGCILDVPLYHRLVEMWEKIHGEKQVNLNQGLDTFWDDAVIRIHDHEFVHECVKFNNVPLHNFIRPDPARAWCSELSFDKLTKEFQAQCALEEILVTAIERGRLTSDSKKSERIRAMKMAHKKLCTSMAKGWYAKYLIINHFDLLHTRKEQWQNQMSKALSLLQNSSKS